MGWTSRCSIVMLLIFCVTFKLRFKRRRSWTRPKWIGRFRSTKVQTYLPALKDILKCQEKQKETHIKNETEVNSNKDRSTSSAAASTIWESSWTSLWTENSAASGSSASESLHQVNTALNAQDEQELRTQKFQSEWCWNGYIFEYCFGSEIHITQDYSCEKVTNLR